MTIKVTDTIVTTSPSDSYPTHLANLGQGGLHSVALISDLQIIPSSRKQAGMMVFVIENQTTYQLLPNLTTWTSDFIKIPNVNGMEDATLFDAVDTINLLLDHNNIIASSGSEAMIGGMPVHQIIDSIVTVPSTIQASLIEHNNQSNAHPELSQFIMQQADRAELAADVAQLNAGIYPNVASGLAAVTEGSYFSVPSSDTNEYLVLYKKNSNVASPIKTFPSSEKINDILDRYPLSQDWLDITVDYDNKFVRGIKIDGSEYIGVNGILEKQIKISPDTDTGAVDMPEWTFLDSAIPLVDIWQELFLDINDNFISGVTKSGILYQANSGEIQKITQELDSIEFQSKLNQYNYDYNTGFALLNDDDVEYLVMVNGQSWAEGAKSGTSGDATVTTIAQHPGKALMFNVGTKPNGAAVTLYVDLKEQETSISFETICSGCADVIMNISQTSLNKKPRIIFTIAALGGQAYFDSRGLGNGLKRGTTTYAESLRLVKAAYDISKSNGKRLVVLSQVVLHGEQDFTNGTSVENYTKALNQWQSDFETDCKHITGQIEPITMYVTQVNRGGTSIGMPANVALAQLSAPNTNNKIVCVGPMYQSPGGTDGAHLIGTGYRMVGRLIGHFLSKDLLGYCQLPLYVVDYWNTNNIIYLKYNMPIVIETTDSIIRTSTLGADGGIKFTDGTLTPPTVTSIQVDATSPDTLIVTLSSTYTGPKPRLFIAAFRQGGGSGAFAGARSAIRSIQSFDADTLTGVTQYYWACQQVIKL